MFVCSCFGITEEQVRAHAEEGACTPRQVASASKAGTDCGSCVRRIQGILGRGGCPRSTAPERGEPALEPASARSTVAGEQPGQELLPTTLPDPAAALPTAAAA